MKTLNLKYFVVSSCCLLIFSCEASYNQETGSYISNNKEEAPQEVTELIEVIKKGDAPKAKELAKKDIINGKNNLVPIIYATLYEQKPIVEDLIAAGANVNETSRFGGTALHYAAFLGNKPIAETLLNAGANVNAVDHFKNTPLHFSEAMKHPEVSALLKAKGANDKATNEIPSLTGSHETLKYAPRAENVPEFLYVIFFTDDADLLKALLDRRGRSIDINKRIAAGVPLPVSYTYMFNRRELQKVLKEKGADYSDVDLWLVSQPNTLGESFAELIDMKKPDLKATSKEGFTILQDATYEGNPELVRVIIDKGADVGQRLTKGPETILEDAIGHLVNRASNKLRRFEVIKVLFEKGAKVGEKAGKAALDKLLLELVNYGAQHKPDFTKNKALFKEIFDKAVEAGADKDNAALKADAAKQEVLKELN
jgi:ankyrin repeat protein